MRPERSPGAPGVLVIDPGDGHGRAALAAVRALAAGGYRPSVGTCGPAALAAASRVCAGRIHLPPPSHPRFGQAVRDASRALSPVAILPASDAAVLELGASGSALLDKSRLPEAVAAAGLAMAPTMVFASGAEAAGASELPYPLVVKPAVPGFPARRIASARALSALAAVDVPLVVQPFLSERLHAVGGVVWRGRIVAAVHQRYLRTWPIDCGTASAAETISPDPDLEAGLLRLLEGFEGIFQAQFAGRYLLDLNPRVYGSLSLAVAAGANLPAVYCDLLRGRDVAPHRARPRVRYRWLEGDARAVFGGLRRGSLGWGEAMRALRPRRATVHSVESIVDPGPMISRLRHAARRRAPAPTG